MGRTLTGTKLNASLWAAVSVSHFFPDVQSTGHITIKMHHSVRFCSIANEETTGGDEQVLKPYNFILRDTYRVSRWNSTVQHEKSTSSCLGKLVNNGTDFPTFLMSMDGDSDLIRYYTQITDGWYDIVSSFTPVNHTMIRTETTDSMSAFTCFSPDVIVITILFLLVFYGLLDYFYNRIKAKGRRMSLFRRKSKNKSSFPVSIITTMLLKQYSAVAGIHQKKGLLIRVILIFLMILMASMQFMFTTFEKTELI